MHNLATKTFWDEYLHEHRSAVNCWMHVAGTVLSWGIAFWAVIAGPWWLLFCAPVAGYVCAWSGHFFVERNRPMTMRDPWQSLCCDYRLTFLLVTGRRPRGVAPQSALDRPLGDHACP